MLLLSQVSCCPPLHRNPSFAVDNVFASSVCFYSKCQFEIATFKEHRAYVAQQAESLGLAAVFVLGGHGGFLRCRRSNALELEFYRNINDQRGGDIDELVVGEHPL